MPSIRRTFAGTTGRGLLPLLPAHSISTRFLYCVGPVDLPFGLRAVTGHRGGQQSLWHLWCVCFYLIAVFRLPLGDPVAVYTVRDNWYNVLCDIQLSCLAELNLRDIHWLETIGRCPDTPGIYIPPGRVALLSCLDVVQIKGLWG